MGVVRVGTVPLHFEQASVTVPAGRRDHVIRPTARLDDLLIDTDGTTTVRALFDENAEAHQHAGDLCGGKRRPSRNSVFEFGCGSNVGSGGRARPPLTDDAVVGVGDERVTLFVDRNAVSGRNVEYASKGVFIDGVSLSNHRRTRSGR